MAPSRAVEPLLPAGWTKPSGYTNGLRIPPDRDLVIVAGMIGWNAQQQLVSAGLVPQFEQALVNILSVLGEAGGVGADLVRVTVYVTDLEDYRARRREVGEAWRRVVGRVYPAMTLVEVSGLLEAGAVVEVEATAAVARRE